MDTVAITSISKKDRSGHTQRQAGDRTRGLELTGRRPRRPERRIAQRMPPP